MDNKTNKILKYETLIRMIDVDGSVISPFHFLDIAIRTRNYLKLTKIMIEKSFEKFKDNNFEFSINFNAYDILDEKHLDFFEKKLKEYDIAKRVIIEITESEQFEHYDKLKLFVARFKAFGCRVAIDDFGTGYSSFEHLINLKIDFIKIDGSMVKNILEDRNSHIITETISSFASKLKAKTIAEFVFNKDIKEKVKELNVDYSQGYHMGAPSPELVDENFIEKD